MKKKELYQRVIIQLNELFKEKQNVISRMATMASVLHYKMENFFWTGFYLIDNGELIVGPYQGSLACLKLEKNKGVCWAAVNQKKTVVVTDVHKFPGHIACDSRSNSEIAVPIFDKLGEVIGILDVDSREYSNFDASDAEYLEKLTNLIFMNIPLTKSSNYFLNEIENAVTVCDADGIILYMNNKSIETFANSGGEKLIGSNLYKCHPGNSKEKLQNIMTAQKTNSYYILKNGSRKLIHQVPRFKSGIFDGFLEISIPIPDTIETFSRD